MRSSRKMKEPKAGIASAAIPAEALEHAFPRLALPIRPPYPPAEAKPVKELPRSTGWLYEPKWDGFRCLAFRSGDEVALQSKAGQPLTRYFPEIVAALLALPAHKFVLDGEIVVRGQGPRGRATLDFDALLQRIHPAASRVQRLAHETPAAYLIFDLLVDEKGKLIVDQPLSARRMKLQKLAERCLAKRARIELSPASADFSTAEKWMREGAANGWDGVVAKRLDCEYTSGERTGMVKVKRIRTADCVVGGFRWTRGGENKTAKGESAQTNKTVAGKSASKKPGAQIGSMLLQPRGPQKTEADS